MKIRTRLFLTFLILVGLSFYLLVNWILRDLQPRYLATMEESMVDTATVLASLLSSNLSDGTLHTSELRTALGEAGHRTFEAAIYNVVKTNLALRVYVTDRRGIVVFDSDNGADEGKDYSQWNDVARTLRGDYGARATRTTPDDPSTVVLYVAAPITSASETIGVLTVCKPASSLNLFRRSAERKIVLAGVLAAGAVLFLCAVISFWITSPLQKLTDYAMAIRDGGRPPAPKLGRGEIGTLSVAFEQMRDALEGKQYVEHYVQTLTHEMKSPLSAIRGAAELIEEDMPPERRTQFTKNIQAEAARMQDFVDRLLQLSAVESRKQLRDVEELRLAEMVREVVGSMAPQLASRHHAVTTELDEDAIVRGERFLIRQALANLLQNAISFSPANENILISLTREGDHVLIAIQDKGPGIPDYAVGKVFDRFYSLRHPDTGTKGSGLGLAFVRETAFLHGGAASIENRPGGGARAVLRLACLPPA